MSSLMTVHLWEERSFALCFISLPKEYPNPIHEMQRASTAIRPSIVSISITSFRIQISCIGSEDDRLPLMVAPCCYYIKIPFAKAIKKV